MAINNVPNTYLRGIVLTCQTTQGPLIIYNYPPDCTIKTKFVNSVVSNVSGMQKEDEYGDIALNGNGANDMKFSSNMQSSEEYDIFASDPNFDISNNGFETAANINLENSFKEFSLLGSSNLEKELSNNLNNAMESSDMSEFSDISTDYANYSSDASSIITDTEDYAGISLTKSTNNPNSIRDQLQVKKRSNTIVTKATIDSSTMFNDSPEFKIIQEFNEKFPADKLHFNKDKICGLDKEIIAEYCLPPRHLCNQRFEFTCDELSFIGLPISSKNADGTWNNKHNESDVANKKIDKINKLVDDYTSDDDNDTESETNDAKSRITKRSLSLNDEYGDSIYVFNLVFILDPLLVEYDQRVDEMYDYVATRFALFLRFFQQESNYLNKEVNEIIKINENFNNSTNISIHNHYKNLLMKSSLCRAITKCYHRISDNKIANLVIDEDKFISLQIPIRNEFKYLPNIHFSRVMKGSFLTSIENVKFLNTSKFNMQKVNDDIIEKQIIDETEIFNYALIFLQDPQDIINDLNNNVGENDLSILMMIDLVKIIKPYNTLKFYKKTMQNLIEQYTNETLSDDEFIMKMLKSFVLHFIYWRQARCILPISSKNKYSVSPLSPMSGQSIDDFDTNVHYTNSIDKLPLFYSLQVQFKQKFPLLPVLSTFLTYFNGEDSFGVHIPSKEHRLMYFQGVEWCIKKGFLTQILTFIYLRVDAKIKSAVEEDLEKEGFLSRNKKFKNKNTKTDKYGSLNAFNTRSASDAIKMTERNNLQDINSDHDGDEFSDSESVLSMESFEDTVGFTIILEPRTSSAIEKRWLYKLVETDFKKSEQKLFYRLLKYFNGETSLEYICVKNGINRTEINQLLKKLGKYVVKVSHW
ncbi:hypothetical protein QEN19_003946 [Hanseniaspora menglaensis]